MKYEEILEQLASLNAQLSAAKKEALKDLKERIKVMGFTAEDIFAEEKKPVMVTVPRNRITSSYENQKLRYINHRNGSKWSGYSKLSAKYWSVEDIPKSLSRGFTHTPMAIRMMEEHGIPFNGNRTDVIAKAILKGFTEAQLKDINEAAERFQKLFDNLEFDVLDELIKQTEEDLLDRIAKRSTPKLEAYIYEKL